MPVILIYAQHECTKRLKTTTIAAIRGMYNTRHYESTLHQGFDVVFCWLPSHVGDHKSNEQADGAAKSATTHLPLAVRYRI
ncbi:hypothetical protein TNCV_4952161 [Trichonephila clavipes]|nr:hypothetical protein TNCV_4952161 [Trichonephila clavipes]